MESASRRVKPVNSLSHEKNIIAARDVIGGVRSEFLGSVAMIVKARKPRFTPVCEEFTSADESLERIWGMRK